MPMTAITPTPVLAFTVPVTGTPTTLSGSTSCVSGSNVNLLALLGFSGIVPTAINVFPLLWAPPPPSTFTFEVEEANPHGASAFSNTIEVATNIPPGTSHTFQWNINPPFSFVGGGTSVSNYAIIKVPSSAAGTLHISVTCTNTCLNISETIQANVAIN